MKPKTKPAEVEEPQDLIIEQLTGGGFNPDRVRFLVYGESGVGKTRFSATWPNPLFLDIDDGLASVDQPVDRLRITEWPQLRMAFEYLSTQEHDYKTIIVDSLNEGQALALADTVSSFPNIRRPYDSLAAQSDYGKMLSDFDNMVRALKSLPIHVVFVAQVTGKEFETDIIQPQLIGKHTARNICRMVDIVGYMYREDQDPVMAFSLSEFTSKDRSGCLPTSIQNPSYSKLAQYWAAKTKLKRSK